MGQGRSPTRAQWWPVRFPTVVNGQYKTHNHTFVSAICSAATATYKDGGTSLQNHTAVSPAADTNPLVKVLLGRAGVGAVRDAGDGPRARYGLPRPAGGPDTTAPVRTGDLSAAVDTRSRRRAVARVVLGVESIRQRRAIFVSQGDIDRDGTGQARQASGEGCESKGFHGCGIRCDNRAVVMIVETKKQTIYYFV
jgi:hypothetical protein